MKDSILECLFTLKNKGSLLASMVPQRTFNISGLFFKVEKWLFRLLKGFSH